MEQLIEYIAKALVDHPDEVKVETSTVDGGRVKMIELKVHRDDVGQVIGKQGRTIKSMRTLLTAASSKSDCRVALEIVE